MKVMGATEEYYFYGMGGQKLATQSCTNGDNGRSCAGAQYNVYFGGKLVKSKGVVVATDRLGSVRANGNGERMSYYPYGEERTSTVDGREKFGTYTRDNAGQDYADQRYYAVGMGRFNTPDPSKGSSPSDPSSWNKYAYVAGDPVNFNDPSGLAKCSVVGVETTHPNPDDALTAYSFASAWCVSNGLTVEVYMTGIPFDGNYDNLEKGLENSIGKDLDFIECENNEAAYLKTYLSRYNSPLANWALTIVQDSDAQGLDDRFIVALSGIESRYGTTQHRDSWGQYNVFSNGAHCATLDNPHCSTVDPYSNYGQAIDGVTQLLRPGGSYGAFNSTAAIYALYETGNANTQSAGTPLLNRIYGNQLHGDVSDVRKPRCVR